ncbi:MAG: FHA domain-containing protein [Rhodoglobus sp.]
MSLRVTGATSGAWAVIASEGRVLIVDALADAEFLESAWAAVQEPISFPVLLDLLTSRGLAATPPFALVDWAPVGTTKVILRGESPLEVTGAEQVSAAGVSTWVELILTDVAGLAFAVPGAVPTDGAPLPLESGVVAAAAVTIGTTSAGDPAPAVRSRASRATAASATPAVVAPAATATAVAAAPAVAAAVEPTAVEPTPQPTPEPAAESAGGSEPATPASAAPAEPIEIDPGVTMASLPERDAAAPAAAGGYDFLFGDTVVRSVADAAVREPDEEAQAEASAAAVAGDHDGHTMLTSDIAKLRGSRKSRGSAAAPPPPPPVAQALVVVVSTTGAREPLVEPILVGRSPSVSKVSGGQIPRLLTIPGGPDLDISRNHVQLALEGGTVVVTDLHSKNGTAVVLPGKPSQRLRPGEPMAVIVGTIVDLGAGITLTVEEER